MRRIAWVFAARIGDKYQIGLTRPTMFQTTAAAGNDIVAHTLSDMCFILEDFLDETKW